MRAVTWIGKPISDISGRVVSCHQIRYCTSDDHVQQAIAEATADKANSGVNVWELKESIPWGTEPATEVSFD